MYEQHPQLDPVPPETTVWRYISFEAYLDILQTSELYFPRVDRMDDPWEGAFGAANDVSLEDRYGAHAEVIRGALRSSTAYVRRWVYISCWHMSEVESDAMWRIYSSVDHGVAIRTTWGRLTGAIRGTEHVSGAAVTYIDYDSELMPEGNIYFLALHKRRSYEYEREARLIATRRPPRIPGSETTHPPGIEDSTAESPEGVRIKVSLPDLVGDVLVSPWAAPWIANSIFDVTRKYGYAWQVERSCLMTRS